MVIDKRAKLAIVIIAALILFGIGAYIFISPILRERTAQQPPSLPSSVTPSQPSPSPSNGGTATQTPTSTPAPAPVPGEAQLVVLENRARVDVERVGSGVSSDGFLGYQDAMADFTASGQQSLFAEQKALQSAHPATGPAYGISTRVAASNITNGSFGDAKLVATVEAIQRVDAGDPSKPTKTVAERITVTFLKQTDGSYLIDSMKWEEVAL